MCGVPWAALALSCKAGGISICRPAPRGVCPLTGLSEQGAGSVSRIGSHISGLGAGPAGAGDHLQLGSVCLLGGEQAAEG